jgi:DNA-binding NarL/FixJ family response regulator
MVNVTDTFTKLYGRPPKPTEVAAMMKLQADRKLMAKLRQPEPEPIKKPAPKLTGKKVNIRAWAINCLMQDGYTKEQIAQILCITIAQIDYNIERQSLPRDDLIKPKSK